MHQAKKYFAFIFHINVKMQERLVHTGQRLVHSGQRLVHTGQRLVHSGQRLDHSGQRLVHSGQRLVHSGQRQTQTLSMMFTANKCDSNIEFNKSTFPCDVAYVIASLGVNEP